MGCLVCFVPAHAESFLSGGLVKIELKRGEWWLGRFGSGLIAWVCGGNFNERGDSRDNSTGESFGLKIWLFKGVGGSRRRWEILSLKFWVTKHSKGECSGTLMCTQKRTLTNHSMPSHLEHIISHNKHLIVLLNLVLSQRCW